MIALPSAGVLLLPDLARRMPGLTHLPPAPGLGVGGTKLTSPKAPDPPALFLTTHLTTLQPLTLRLGCLGRCRTASYYVEVAAEGKARKMNVYLLP